jgi:hypothetical protein
MHDGAHLRLWRHPPVSPDCIDFPSKARQEQGATAAVFPSRAGLPT